MPLLPFVSRAARADRTGRADQAVGAVAKVDFRALGTTASVLVTDSRRLDVARVTVAREVETIDRACSRFRDDSELTALNQRGGTVTPVSTVLMEAIEVALHAARVTGGLVDPTMGALIQALGYDRSFADVQRSGDPIPDASAHDPLWRQVVIDRERSTVLVPAGAVLDLGATAKALCADRAARAAARATGVGVLVSLGGDMATAGASPDRGWDVLVTDDHGDDLSESPTRSAAQGQVIALLEGGLATSGTSVRRWVRGDRQLHHLIDPRTGTSAESPWRTASVVADSCVEANTASTAAMVLGEAAPGWLAEHGLAARLVARDGAVVLVGGWPPPDPV